MRLKDYYAILELPPSATVLEIKKAYRRLAHQLHPDKNANDAGQFAEIKEAYEVLTNPAKKEYYLQHRWYQQSLGKRKFQTVFTPVNLLQQILELERFASRLDAYRLDREGLFNYVMDLVPDDVINKLNKFREVQVNQQIIHGLLKSTQHFTLLQLNELGQQVRKIEPKEFANEQVELTITRKKKGHYWDRSRIWIVITAVILLCIVIFLAAK